MPREQAILAVYAVVRRNGDVLLARRFNTGYEDGKYGLVAGHVESGEHLTEALVREVYEESGLRVDVRSIRLIHVMQRASVARLDFFFDVLEWIGDPMIREPDKCDQLSWFPIHKLPATTIPYVRVALEMIGKDLTYSEFVE